MSLIGIDVGSNPMKVTAYSEEGKLFDLASNPIMPQPPRSGWWEQDGEEIWRATSVGMRFLAAKEALRRDSRKAIIISASGLKAKRHSQNRSHDYPGFRCQQSWLLLCFCGAISLKHDDGCHQLGSCLFR